MSFLTNPILTSLITIGKPAIIGQRLPTTYTYHPEDSSRGLSDCFEVDLDVNAAHSVGKTACNMSRRYMSSVTVDLGFVIEGRTEDLVSLSFVAYFILYLSPNHSSFIIP